MFLLTPFLAAALPALISGAGALFARHQSRRDLDRQNEYNSPLQQLNRLKQAGLPMAAMGNNVSNTQSALPQAEGLGKNIGSHISTSIQQMQIEMMKEEIRMKKAEADLKNAERDYLLSHQGEDQAGTNLTGNIKATQGITRAQEKAANLTNIITGVAAENARTKTGLENQKAIADIASVLTNTRHTTESIRGTQLDNIIKNIVAQYQPEMSEAQLQKLLSDNRLTNTNIDLNEIRTRIERATEQTQISTREVELGLKELTYDRVAEEFINYKQYQEFVEMLQSRLRDGAPFSPIGDIKALIALVYTTITGLTGQSNMNSNILNHIK